MNNLRTLLLVSATVNFFLGGWWLSDRLWQPPRMDIPPPPPMMMVLP